MRITRRTLFSIAPAAWAAGSEPQNISFPLQTVEGVITPSDRFFVRDHFAEPEVSLRDWTLRLEGRVARPLELSFADLLEAPTKKAEVVLECAGNAAGGPAVGNGVWEGVPLSWLLNQAGVAADAAHVLLEGADSGKLMPSSAGFPYYQVVPVQKCLSAESLVAFKLNDRYLPRRNGFPARALFPGWYGMDSVKWLRRVMVLGPDEVAAGFAESGMNRLYNRVVENSAGERTATRLTEIQVKSVLAWPPDKSKLPAGRHQVYGFAWTGAGVVRSVQVSVDGVWSPVVMPRAAKPLSWVRWEYSWLAAPGEHTLLARATDDAGRTQPLVREAGRRDGYALNFCDPVRCSVR